MGGHRREWAMKRTLFVVASVLFPFFLLYLVAWPVPIEPMV